MMLQKVSTGIDMSKTSALVAARSLVSEDRRVKSGVAERDVPKLICRFPGSFKEASESSIQQDKHYMSNITSSQHKEDGRTCNKEPVLLGYGSRGHKIHFSGPLVAPGNVDQMLKDNDRHIQEAIRRARLDKAKVRKIQEGNHI